MTNTISSQASSMLNNTSTETPAVSEGQKVTRQQKSSEPATKTQIQLSRKEAETLVIKLNEQSKSDETSIQYKLYDKLHEYYIQIIDTNTNTVIQDIPSKTLLDNFAAMLERVGMLVDKKI